MDTAQEQIEALERQRLAAISGSDVAAMAQLLAEDYVHVNSTGRVIDKAGFLKSMAGRARETTRGALSIQVYGDTAVIFGAQSNRSVKPDQVASDYVATQIVRRVQGRWQLVLMQLTQKVPREAG